MNSEPVKFLLVDDIEDNLVALEALLRRDGLELLKARSGAEALELLLVHDVALALLDVHMPEMDGFELAELMRGTERTKHVPIIFVTAGSRNPSRIFKGYESGAVDFLFKPVEPHILRSKADVFFELYRQKMERSQALRLNEMFIGILGHDLRTPLGAMLTGAHLLKRPLTEEQRAQTLARMISSGERMTEMVEQLLDLTRARLVGGLGFARARTRADLAELVQRCVEELRIAHPQRDLVLTSSGDTATAGDEGRLLQLITNLLENALRHGAKDSSVTVDVAGNALEVVVLVQNRGVIPAELLPVLFDPFRTRQSRSSKSRGLGLGLYISQQIALAHGGKVEVQSNEASGTSFTVRIPHRAVDHKEVGTERKRTILIVDDDDSARESLRAAFEGEGYRAIVAADGGEALTRLKDPADRPDAVILDLVLPVMDGIRLYRTMQEDPALAKTPVIISTADPSLAPAGLVVVPKPVRLEKLLGAVADLW